MFYATPLIILTFLENTSLYILDLWHVKHYYIVSTEVVLLNFEHFFVTFSYKKTTLNNFKAVSVLHFI